jgi:hypothetical protein
MDTADAFGQQNLDFPIQALPAGGVNLGMNDLGCAVENEEKADAGSVPLHGARPRLVPVVGTIGWLTARRGRERELFFVRS